MPQIKVPAVPEGFVPRLQPEALSVLAPHTLQEAQVLALRTRLWEQLLQATFWDSEVGTSDAEFSRVAADREVTAADLQKALDAVLEPERDAKRKFIIGLLDSNGDIGQIGQAYEARSAAEAENGAMNFDADDVGPYRINLVGLFEKVFARTMAKDEQAKELLKALIRDFGTVPGLELRDWLARQIEFAIPDDMAAMAFRDRVRSQPEAFDELVDKFLDGGVVGLLEPTEVHESIADDLEAFAGDVEAAIEFAVEDGARTFLNEFHSSEALVGHEAERDNLLRERFGCDLAGGVPVTEHFIEGTPGTPGEGQIQVSLFPTKDPQVFLAKYTYPDGEAMWAIRPLEVEE